MYELKIDSSYEEYLTDLAYLSATLKAAHKKGRIGEEATGLIQRIKGLMDEADTLIVQRRDEERAGVETAAEIRIEEGAQEDAVDALFKDCMSQAGLDRQAPLVKALFEGGVSAMMRPAIEAQNEIVRVVVGKLETQDQYAGALRDAHVPALQATIDEADRLLKRRAQHKRAQEQRALTAQGWKQRVNELRAEIAGWLMQQHSARGLAESKRRAREFFKR